MDLWVLELVEVFDLGLDVKHEVQGPICETDRFVEGVCWDI